MWVAQAQQLRELDERVATEAALLPAVLMEHAGLAVARRVAALLGRSYEKPDSLQGTRVAVLSGPGNNGGDGSVAARLLASAGSSVSLVLLGSPERLGEGAARNYQAAQAAGVNIWALDSAQWGQPIQLERLRVTLAMSDLIVDALLGTGARLPLAAPYRQAVAAVRQAAQAGKPVLAVDLPTGVGSDDGQVDEECVSATATVTFGWLKPALLLYPAAAHCGEVWLEPIAFPQAWLQAGPRPAAGGGVRLLTPDDLAGLVKPRVPDTHKGTYGHLLIWGGSPGLAGAPQLAAQAALRAGAGLVTVAGPETVVESVNRALPDALTLALPEPTRRREPVVDPAAVASDGVPAALLAQGTACRAVVIGPGLGQQPRTDRWLSQFVQPFAILPATASQRRGEAKPEDAQTEPGVARLRVLLDADGLNALARGVLPTPLPAGAEWVLTPHPGEMARLLGWSVAQVQANRWEAARQAADRFGAVVVLKGAHTVVTAPGGVLWTNPTGNPGMAVGGMGDVLAGVIGALLLHPELTPEQAARLGVYWHGLAGDWAAAERGEVGLIASDVPAYLGPAWEALRQAVEGRFGRPWRQQPLHPWYLDQVNTGQWAKGGRDVP